MSFFNNSQTDNDTGFLLSLHETLISLITKKVHVYLELRTAIPAYIYLLKTNIKTRKRCEICSKLKI